MKKLLLPIVSWFVISPIFANDTYSNMVYTASSFMYWCEFKEVPESSDDLAKVTNINEPNQQITISPETWFSSVKMNVKGEELQVIRTSENGKSTSTSNCGSFEIKPKGSDTIDKTKM